MLRTRSLARMLWSLAGIAGLAGCGRLGFGDNALAVVTPPLDLITECGVAPEASDVEILNDGTTPLVIVDATASDGFAVESQLPLTIQPGATAVISIAAPPAVIGTDVAGAIKTGVLTLVTNEPDMPERSFELTARVIGAQLDFTEAGGMPVTLTFSSAVTCPTTRSVVVKNVGDMPASLTLMTPSSFTVTGMVAGTLDAGSSGSFNVRVNTEGPCSGAEPIAYAVTGSVCSTTPVVLAASFTITGVPSCSCS